MSDQFDDKRDDILDHNEETIFSEEQIFEDMVEQGPMLSIAPEFGSNKNVVERYSHCPICGGRLHFTHVSDFSRNTTHEKSSCPECGLDAKQVLHRLQ